MNNIKSTNKMIINNYYKTLKVSKSAKKLMMKFWELTKNNNKYIEGDLFMTNLGKTREEIIYEIVLSLSKGNNGSIDAVYRVNRAIEYYEELKRKEIIYEVEDKLDEKELPLVEFSDTTGDEIM